MYMWRGKYTESKVIESSLEYGGVSTLSEFVKRNGGTVAETLLNEVFTARQKMIEEVREYLVILMM